MKSSPGRSPTSSIFGSSGVSVSFLQRVLVCLSLSLRQMRAYFFGYASNSHSYRVYNKFSGLVEESSNMEFDEHNGSQVGQSDLNDVGDEIPPEAIRRMGVGHFLPVEEPLVAEGEGQCSTQVEPSPPQDQQANQEQDEGPLATEQDQGQDHIIDEGDAPSYDQGQVLFQGKAQDDEQVLDGAPSSEMFLSSHLKRPWRKKEHAEHSRLHPG